MEPNKREKTYVVVLNMHYTGIGIARSLYDLGVPVIGLGHNANCFGAHTKFCEFQLSPGTHDNPEKLLSFLINLANNLKEKAILLPTRDFDVIFISKYYEKLNQHYLISQAKPEIIQNITEKDNLYTIAKTISVSCPKQLRINTHEDLVKNRNDIDFPCVAKPLSSHAWRDQKLKAIVENKKAIDFKNFEDLSNFYLKIKDQDPKLLVQEKIEGPESKLFIFGAYISKDQSSIHYYTARKLLQYPLNFGTGIILETFDNSEIVDKSIQLIKKLNYSGICEIEYKYCEKRNQYYLIEINTRHWDQHLLGLAYNINLTKLLYLDYTETKLPSPENYTYKHTKTKWIADQDLPFVALSLLLTKEVGFKEFINLMSGKKIFSSIDFRDLRLCFFTIKTSIVSVTKMTFTKLIKSLHLVS